MMALQVKAQIDTLSEMSPDAALYQVDETINTLRSCSVALETELTTTKSRMKKLDYHARECVGRALENPAHQKSHRIINEMFEAPSHWTLPGGNATSAEIHSAATKALREDVEEARRSKAQNKSVARSELQRNLRELW